MRILSAALFLSLAIGEANAQFSPQVGIAGSDAVSKTSPAIRGWATQCTVARGLQQMGNPNGGPVLAGDTSLSLGMADGALISLGDSGVAVLGFSAPIVNGPGPDFAVFENGFANAANPEEAFLELAFVEVSSDGMNFFRFPATSNTQHNTQLSSVSGMNFMNARNLNNLAGKHIGGWGTPFDLEELSGTTGLDINHVTHVRLIDVIGAIEGFSSKDAGGNIINDPFPTAFPTGGFDLDAVAVLNSSSTSIFEQKPSAFSVSVYPNPAGEMVSVKANGAGRLSVLLTDLSGRALIRQSFAAPGGEISLKDIPSGIYFLSVQDERGTSCTQKVYHY